MAYTARKLDYYYTTLTVRADEAYELLENLAKLGVNFLALTLVPIGPDSTQLTLFPEDASLMKAVAKQAGLVITGPHCAILVQGDDQAGALASIHKQLRQEDIEVFSSTAITDGTGKYGCILYLRPEDADRAVRLLAH